VTGKVGTLTCFRNRYRKVVDVNDLLPQDMATSILPKEHLMLQLDRQKRSYNKRGNEEIFMRPDGREKESAKYRELDGYVKERVQDSMMAVMNEVSQA
jgi:hypothetical protein